MLSSHLEICRICGHCGVAQRYLVRERMYGIGEEFPYFQCDACDCLQIEHIPEEMTRFYPRSYYSLARRRAKAQGRVRRSFRAWRARSSIESRVSFEPVLERLFGHEDFMRWFRNAGVRQSDAILDLGCGSGELLLSLQAFGFRDLTGFEPFIEADLHYPRGTTVWKRSLDGDTEAQGARFDLVMSHHSFEHVPDPLRVLRAIHGLLKPGKLALIRIPVLGEAWETYRERWVQLDAPRHFHLHSQRSMRLLATLAGFEVERVEYDGGVFQFQGSELYLRDITLTSFNEMPKRKRDALFPRGVMKAYARRAQELNRQERGDAAAFYLRKAARADAE